MKKIFILLLVFLELKAYTQSCDSLTKPMMMKYRYHASAGLFFSNTSTNLRVDANFIGAVFGLERDLGYSESGNGFRAEFMAQLSKRSILSLYYFQLNKSKSLQLERTITIQDTTFTPGVNMDSFFNVNSLSLDYRYCAFTRKNWNAGFSAGLKLLQVHTGFKAVTNNGYNFNVEYNTPVPTIFVGLHGSAYLNPNFLGRYSMDYFGLEIEGIRGRVVSNRVSLEYFILKNLGLGASYSYLTYKVRELPVSELFKGELDYTIYGVNIFLSGRF